MAAIESIKVEVKEELDPLKISTQKLETQMENLNILVEKKFDDLQKRLDLNDV